MQSKLIITLDFVAYVYDGDCITPSSGPERRDVAVWHWIIGRLFILMAAFNYSDSKTFITLSSQWIHGHEIQMEIYIRDMDFEQKLTGFQCLPQ
jgi:hypothetical protein